MSEPTRAVGIEPVPSRLRVLGGLDTGLFWGNLGVSLLVIVAGTILVPALSLPGALLAILAGCLIGNLMLGAAGAIGAQAGVPAMVLMRAPLGRRGSILPTAVNVVQCLGWTVFELIVIATAAAALSDELFGVGATWAWTLAFGAAALGLGLLGPVGVVRRVIRRIAVWIVPAAIAYLTWWAVAGGLDGAWSRSGEGGLTVWQGVDIVVAVTVSWIPLAADYTRFCRTERSAFWGTAVGYFVPDAWLLALGAVLFFSRDLGAPAALPAAVVAGGALALLALVALTAAETDDAFANAYSAAVSLQNLLPAAPLRLLVVVTTTLGTAGALAIDLVSYQSFLLLLGSVFVPLFAVLLADWLVAGREYTREDVFAGPRWRVGPIAAWLGGFLLYQWLSPTGPAWWVEQIELLRPPDWSLGATVPCFIVTFVVALVVNAASRRVTPRPVDA